MLMYVNVHFTISIGFGNEIEAVFLVGLQRQVGLVELHIAALFINLHLGGVRTPIGRPAYIKASPAVAVE